MMRQDKLKSDSWLGARLQSWNLEMEKTEKKEIKNKSVRALGDRRHLISWCPLGHWFSLLAAHIPATLLGCFCLV
jgi:hypothetical protein